MPWLSDLGDKISDAIKSGNGIVFRVVAFLVSGFFFATYPFYLFGFYMANHGFYAYEMLDNLLSLRILFFAGFLLLAIVGAFLVFSVPAVVISYRELRKEASHTGRALMIAQIALSILLNVALLVAFLYGCINNPTPAFVAPILVAVTLGVLFMVIAFCRGRTYFATLSVVIVFAFLLPMANTAGAARLFEISLQHFNLGGIYSEVTTPDGALQGNLIFLSPTHVYLQVESKNRFAIIPRKDDVVINFVRFTKHDP
ncbi:hypothetical protein [Paucibacter sp. KCTC 42545]|uniref:hypothetical protein n=1 Tax=Paucibacter sp. KCTC 42545 TaxID=1768242 RepID=UPI0012E3EE2A|nr:hypothetical protein [Paucibacter sp. KCTC 42545]